MRPRRRAPWGSLRRAPFQVATCTVGVPIGIGAMLLGSQVSTAMSRVLGDSVDVVRLWGVLMVAGGLLTVIGRGWLRPGVERAGLMTLGPAYALYAVSVLLGLGVGGLVAGPMFGALAVACLARVRASLREQAVEAALLRGPGGG